MARPKNQKQIITVANTEITIGDVLEITPKRNLDAPSGFVEFGTSKLLMSGIKELRAVPFDEDRRVYDTGFDEDSICNRAMDKEGKKANITLFNSLIKEPYEKRFRVDANSTNDDFWASYTYEIYTGKTFDTSKEKDLFDLFHALKQGRVCEQGEKDPTLQRAADYNIKNNKKVQTLKEQKSEDKFEAMATFKAILDAFDPKKDDSLYAILEWIQVPNVRGTDKETLKRVGIRLFDHEKNGYDNARRFLEAYEMSKGKEGADVMEMFSIITKLYNKQKIEYKRQQYWIDGTLLGNHLKEAATVATKDNSIKELILGAYEKIS